MKNIANSIFYIYISRVFYYWLIGLVLWPLTTAWAVSVDVTEITLDGRPAFRVNVDINASHGRISDTKRFDLDHLGAEFDSNSATLTLVGVQGRRWVGRFASLASYGRAGVAGLEIAWRSAGADGVGGGGGSGGDGEAIYGLGERFDALNLAGRRVGMWIEDAPGQGDGSSYVVTPVVFSSAGYGFFAEDNPEGVFDFDSAGDGWHRYRRAGTSASFVVCFGPDVPSLIRQRTALVGGLRAAPAWAYEPWISKNSYETQAEAEAAMDGMRSRGLGFGVIVLEAWKGRSETGEFNRFSPDRWPDVEGFLARCRREGVKVVLWQVPILHPSSPWFARARDRGLLVRDPEGGVSLREHWLSGFGNIDFFQPEAVAFYKDMLRPVVRRGIAGFKADDGEAIKPTDRLGPNMEVPGWQAHNEYSARYNRATFEVLAEEGVDGMLWARSGSLGIESAPGIWAGDQGADWAQLRTLVTAGLSMGLSGMPYWGHDIGGYFGTCTPELYVRWLQFGALSPFMQFHGVEPREPWHFGERAVEAYRMLTALRANLMPELLALGEESAATGMPIMRPMFFVTGEHGGPALADQYLLGEDLLVAPVMEAGRAGRVVRFPAGDWLHATSATVYRGPGSYPVAIGTDDAPLFVRRGSTVAARVARFAALVQARKATPTGASGDEGGGEGSGGGGVTGRWLNTEPSSAWPDRPVLRDVEAPLTGHPLGGSVAVSFAMERGDMAALRGSWWYADGPGERFEASIRAVGGGRYAMDLTPGVGGSVGDATAAAGRRQVYTIETMGRDGGPSLRVLGGEVEWTALLNVTLEGANRDVVLGGSARVSGTVTNRSSVGGAYTLHLSGPAGVRIDEPTRTVELEAGASHEFDWPIEVSGSAVSEGSVGDLRVAVEARAGAAVLDRESTALIASPRWLVAGPFKAESRMAGFGATTAAEWAFGPEAVIAHGPDRLRWEAVDPARVAAWDGLNFNELFGQRENAFAYAMAVIESDRDQDVQVRVGSDDTLSLWVNGRMLIAEGYDRGAAPDQDVIDAHFRRGENRLLVKVAQGVGGWELLTRFTTPDGGPVPGLSDGLRDWRGYAADRPKREASAEGGGGGGSGLRWRVLGPFETARGGAVRGVARLERAIESGRALPGAVRSLRWRPLAVEGPGYASLKSVSRDDYVLAYAATAIELAEASTVELRCGSDDGLVLWVNDRKVIDAERPRAFKPNEDVARVALPAGRHRIVARVSQGQGDWGLDVSAWRIDGGVARPLDSP